MITLTIRCRGHHSSVSSLCYLVAGEIDENGSPAIKEVSFGEMYERLPRSVQRCGDRDRHYISGKEILELFFFNR